MISGLLKIASLTQLKPVFSEVPITTFLNSIFQDVACGHTLNIHHEDTEHLYSDPDLLTHIFQNLFLNSAQFCDKALVVDVYIRTDRRLAIIDYFDNGPGIPEDHLNVLFNAFHKHEKSKGLGIGLNIAKRAIQQLDGTIVCLKKDDGAHFKMKIENGVNPPRKNFL